MTNKSPALAILAPSRVGAYALPDIPIAMLLYCVAMIIPGFYATYAGVAPATIGSVIVIARLFDAITDPVIGVWSDRTRSRLGARKPWMIAGGLVSIISIQFLFTPGTQSSGLYLLGWIAALYLGWTMMIVPYDAWGAEISRDYVQRSRIFAYRASAYYFGSILFLASPLLPIFETTEFSAEVITFNATSISVLIIICVASAVLFAPDGQVKLDTARPRLKELAQSLRQNRPMKLFLIVYMLNGLSLGMFLPLSFVYVVNYLALPDKFSIILLGFVVASFVAMPLWLKSVKRFGKLRAWSVGIIINTICYPPLALLGPGDASFLPAFGWVALAGAAGSATTFLAASVFGDVIDFDHMRTHKNRAANYFAIKSLATKANIALGGGIAFIGLDLFNYDPSSSDNDLSAKLGFLFLFLGIPSVLSAVSGILVWKFPIDERRHAIIRRRIDRRVKIPVQESVNESGISL